jgi:hypothetical protein
MDIVNYGYDFRLASLSNAPLSQKIGIGIDTLMTTALLAPQAQAIAVPLTFWDIFVFGGEKITGQSASDSQAYVEGLKERARNGWNIPGFNFSKPTLPGSSVGPISPSSGPGSNGQPQPQKTQGGYQSGGGSQSFSAQIASIQRQIQSIQNQINQIVQARSQTQGR